MLQGKGRLYLSYFNKLSKGKGKKISIALYNPDLKEGAIDDSFKQLAPSEKLFKAYKYDGLSFEEYTDIYLAQLQNMCYVNDSGQLKALEGTDLYELIKLLDSGIDVTVYCYEKEYRKCHRFLLGIVVNKFGYKVYII